MNHPFFSNRHEMPETTGEPALPTYLVRHLAGEFEEFSCLFQLEDESAAMYFNIVHGSRFRRRFTTERAGEPCKDYVLIAEETGADGSMKERAIALFDITG